MIDVVIENEQVLYMDNYNDGLSCLDIDQLVQSIADGHEQIRICTHISKDNLLHEMIIVHTNKVYVRPHRHIGKSESMHIIDGTADLLIFDESGNITQIIELGDYKSGKTFYYRMNTPVYHALLIKSDILVYHETTNGPFNKGDTDYAQWAPDASDINAVANYRKQIIINMDKYKKLRISCNDE